MLKLFLLTNTHDLPNLIINFNVIKMINFIFINKFTLNSTWINIKILNLKFLKFYFLVIQKIPVIKSYFFFNFLFYKKLWSTSIVFLFKPFCRSFLKKHYKRYYFLTHSSFFFYNFTIFNNFILFFKNNKNYIFKQNLTLTNFLNFKLLLFFYNFIQNHYFFNFFINTHLVTYLHNLNFNINLLVLSKTSKKQKTSINFIFNSLRQPSIKSLLNFNKLI